MLGVSNSNVTMNFLQLHYFLSQNIGGQKILCPPLQNLGGTCTPRPPLTLGPSLPGLIGYCEVIM